MIQPERVALDQLEIHEAETFRQARVELLDKAYAVLRDLNLTLYRIPGSRGLARLINLTGWESTDQVEYLDDYQVHADQVVHFATHQVLDLHGKGAHHMLFTECLASATDLYLLGKLSRAGYETEFLHETMESFGSFYHQYAADEAHLEALCRLFCERPFETMVDVANYLYRFCDALLYGAPNLKRLLAMEQNLFYPLVHHYQTTNWLLTIRAKFPRAPVKPTSLEAIQSRFCQSESTFLRHFHV